MTLRMFLPILALTLVPHVSEADWADTGSDHLATQGYTITVAGTVTTRRSYDFKEFQVPRESSWYVVSAPGGEDVCLVPIDGRTDLLEKAAALVLLKHKADVKLAVFTADLGTVAAQLIPVSVIFCPQNFR